MIKVELLTTANGDLVGFNISGHAKAGESGQDIVCAAVSSAAYMAANTITEVIHAMAEISVNQMGFMKVEISSKDLGRCQEILNGLKLHLLGLEEQYPKNIIVNYVEV